MQRPIRIKGYWRAVRRKEPWALEIERLRAKGGFEFLCAWSMRTVDFSEVVKSYAKGLGKLQEKEKLGDLYTVPVLLGKEHGTSK